jgi:hypothetical protein
VHTDNRLKPFVVPCAKRWQPDRIVHRLGFPNAAALNPSISSSANHPGAADAHP